MSQQHPHAQPQGCWYFGPGEDRHRMSTSTPWRALLDQLHRERGHDTDERWTAFREALCAFAEAGPDFTTLTGTAEVIARSGQVGGVATAPAQFATWNAVVSTRPEHRDQPPPWPYVELLVRTWAAYHRQQPHDTQRVLHRWASGYRACGGNPGPHFPASFRLDRMSLPTPTTPPVPTLSTGGAELPAVAVSGATPAPSRWLALRDWMRQRPKKLLIASATVLVLAVSTGSYMLVDTTDDGGKDKAVEVADGTPSPLRAGPGRLRPPRRSRTGSCRAAIRPLPARRPPPGPTGVRTRAATAAEPAVRAAGRRATPRPARRAAPVPQAVRRATPPVAPAPRRGAAGRRPPSHT